MVMTPSVDVKRRNWAPLPTVDVTVALQPTVDVIVMSVSSTAVTRQDTHLAQRVTPSHRKGTQRRHELKDPRDKIATEC